MRKKVEVRANLVRPFSGEYYTPLEDWEIIALGDKVKIETARSFNNDKLHVTYYVQMDK